MKKILFILSCLMLSVCVQAQVMSMKNVKPATVGMMKQGATFGNPGINEIVSKNMRKAPRKVQLAENERLLGLYTTDDCSLGEKGMGLGSNATYSVFSIVPRSSYKFMIDGNITAIRFALANKVKVNKVFVVGVTSDDYLTMVYEQNTELTSFQAGWNTVKLDTPCPLDLEGIDRVGFGFELVETGNYPISRVDGDADEGFLLMMGNDIYNQAQFGLLSVQAIVQCDNLPELDVMLDGMVTEETVVASGASMQYGFDMMNVGTKEVTSYQIDVKLDGKLVKSVTENDMAMTHSVTTYVGTLNVPSDIARGSHTLSAELVKVNGAAPTTGLDDDKTETVFSTYMASDVVARQKHLVEEFTSHSCTYCPLGAQLLEVLQEQREVAMACIHGNQSSKDPFNTAECESLMAYCGISSFPSAAFNRLYWGEDGVALGIGYDASQHAKLAAQLLDIMDQYSTPAFASVDIEKNLSGDGKKLTIKVSGQGGESAREVLDGFGLTVYVLEDSLKYRQLNNGMWVANYIHNHVLRKVATAINGDDLNWKSAQAYENNYVVDLDETWVADHLSIVAFISKRQPLNRPDWADMGVSNANSVKLTDNNGGGGQEQEDVRVDAGLRITPFSNATQLMGEGMSQDGRYVAGQNYGTYAPCIWNSETGAFTNFPDYEEGSVHAVNNLGMAVGTDRGYGGKALICYVNGTAETLADNGGDKSQGADAWCISADGKTIGGFYYYFEWTNEAAGEGFYATFPCVWQDKKCVNLPYPTAKEVGFNIDGAGCRWMSADASVLLGYLVDDKATWPAVIWRKNAQGGYDCDPICKDYFEAEQGKGKPYMMFNPCALSANGEWVALQIQEEYDENDWNNVTKVKVARLNLKSGKLEILENEQSLAPSAISDEGSVLMYTNVDGIFGRVGYLWKAGETQTICIDDLLNKVKGMPNFGANVPAAYAADNQTIMGFGIDQDANIFSYVVSLAAIEQALTGVEETLAEPVEAKHSGIYTIQGHKVASITRPGLYIVNGKKVMVK